MTEQITNQLIQFGGGTAFLVALTFFLKTLTPLIIKRNNNKSQNFETRLKKIENEDYHYLRSRIDKLDERIDKFENRLTRVETKMNNK